MSDEAKILLIEDDPGIRETLCRVLAQEGHQVEVEGRGDDGLARAGREPFNVVITDLRMPGINGLDLVRQLHTGQPHLPIILITAFGTTETAIEATKLGAYDYVLKPFHVPSLLDLVRKAAESNRLMSDSVALGDVGPRDALVGQSPAMQAIYKEIGRVASKPVSVLIRGDTGTGKELVARALYQHSNRANEPFVAINCAAIPETLLESELFGHERGTFTGAQERRIGRFEQANHGTIFLDEIGDMALGTQVKLMRVLQERSLQRLGGTETIEVDVRILAATHRDLEKAISEKLFREDLYYRLSVVVIRLPSLRQRREDIPALIHFFLKKHGPELGNPNPSIHPSAMEMLQSYHWPGNVRELENVIRKSVLVAQTYTINADHVQAALNQTPEIACTPSRPLGECIDDLLGAAQRGEVTDAYTRFNDMFEREIFARAIKRAQGNQAKAARWLGVSRITMKAKLLQYGLHPAQEQTS
jgi:nitrogen regulation protein NR(I)